MTLVIGGIARKGGVGKTTTIMNLAAACARAGLFTVVVEADGQGNASRRVGLEERDDLFDLMYGGAQWEDVLRPVPPQFTNRKDTDLMLVSAWNGTREIEEDKRTPAVFYEKVNLLRGWADVVLIDTSPGITQLHTAVYYTSDYVYIPTMTELDCIESVGDTLNFLDTARAKGEATNFPAAKLIGVLPTRMAARDNTAKVNHEMLKMMYRHRPYPPRILPAISAGVAWQESRNRLMSIYAHREVKDREASYDRASAVEAVRRFEPFATEVVSLVQNSLEVTA